MNVTVRAAVFFCAVAMLSLTGCSGACEDLQVICDYCLDPNQRTSCEQSVDTGEGDVCERDFRSFCSICGRQGESVIEECK